MQPRSRKFADKIRDQHSKLNYSFYRMFRSPKLVNPEKVKNILCIELLYLGDLIVTTPSIRALKESFPNAEITFVLPRGMKSVLEGNPYVKHIIEVNPNTLNSRGIKDMSRSLRSMQFDMGVLFYPGNRGMGKLLKKSKIPIRVGCAKTGFLEGKGWGLTHKVNPTTEKKNYVEENLDVVRLVGAEASRNHLELYTDADLENYFHRNSISKEDLIVVIHPGPRNPTHKWLNLRYSAVIDALVEKYDVKIIITGVKKDEKDIEEIVSTTKHGVITAINMPLKEYFGIIERANLVISVDTGGMHVAAGLNRPVVSLFGAGEPKVWQPHCEHSRVLFKPTVCTSCHRYKCRFKGKREQECMKAITVEDVLVASDELLEETKMGKEIKINIPTTQELVP